MPNISLPKMAKLIERDGPITRINNKRVNLEAFIHLASDFIIIPPCGTPKERTLASERALQLAKDSGYHYVMIGSGVPIPNTSSNLYIVNFYNQK